MHNSQGETTLFLSKRIFGSTPITPAELTNSFINLLIFLIMKKIKFIFKNLVFAILLAVSMLLLLADGVTCMDILMSKLLFLADAIFMGYLWQWWHMDDYYKNLLDEEG